MSRIDGYPLRQIVDLPAEHVASLFASLMALIVRLARAGLIHCDFNEFNIMVREVREEGEENEEDEVPENDGTGVWGVGNGLRRGGQLEEESEDGQGEYQLKPGERIEKGKGFERIYREEVVEEDEDEEDDDEEEEDDDEDDGESYKEEEFDEDGTNEGLKIELSDGSAIEPIVIDFPQMVSVEHVNAE